MKVSPSLLSANFMRLEKDIEMINSSEADFLHMDVMDGVFVPNISFGFDIIESVAEICVKPLDVHLMIVHPEQWVNRVRDTGASIMNVHQEACLHLDRTIYMIHQAGMKAGVTLNPATPVDMLQDIICEVELVLLMSVNPGFGGQPFINNTYKKVKQLRDLIDNSGSKALIEVDGGVNDATAPQLAKVGADILVSGSYIFKSKNPIDTIKSLAKL